MGMVNLNELPETPSSQMQALAFAVQELALYLDTHRDDREALELYRRYQQLLEKVRAEYQKRFGPLNHGTPQTSESYQWLDDPWPWEYTTNKELQYPVKIAAVNPRLAAIIISQYGGPDGELGASLRYLSQRYAMPFDELKGLLTDIGTEEPEPP